MKKVLINISNIHAGGALQVGISFVSELLKIPPPKNCVKVLISSEIADAFELERLTVSSWNIEVLDTYGLKTLFSEFNFEQRKYDLVFTLFGPKYTWLKAKKDIVGFAQPWILELDNPLMSQLNFLNRLKLRAKFGLQKQFFKRADHLVVELEHVKQSLTRQNLFPKDKITVVHNTLSGLYLDASSWQSLNIEPQDNKIAIGYVTRDYLHKNIAILPKVAKLLHKKYQIPVKFYLSLNESEWQNYKDNFGEVGYTVGSLNVYQCPYFYQKMDAVIFPSLLECFSATPLEALAMKKPLFASNRGFVKDVCGDYSIYFDPVDADDIAKKIAEYFKGQKKTDIEIEAARQHVLNFSNPRQRALDYLRIIEQELEN